MTLPRRKHILLTVTQDCNLDCVYCYQNYKSKRSMPFSVAMAALERHIISSDSHDEVQIEFSGGEPFLRFKLIRQIAESVWSKAWPKPYFLFATTNGTLIHGRIKEWLSENKQRFTLALSLDGTREMHNINRSSSFDRIDWNFFRTSWPKQSVKMTVSQYTLPKLAEGVKFLHSLGFNIEGNLAHGLDWSDPENISILSEQLDELISYYVDNPTLEPCGLLSMDIRWAAIDTVPIKKWCGTGTDMVAVDVDGKDYPCHLFEPASLGVQAKTTAEMDFTDVSSLRDNRCDGCPLLPICPTCYGINLLKNGNPAIRESALCTLSKVRALACSKMHALKLQSSSQLAIENQESASSQYQLIGAINKIQSAIPPTIHQAERNEIFDSLVLKPSVIAWLSENQQLLLSRFPNLSLRNEDVTSAQSYEAGCKGCSGSCSGDCQGSCSGDCAGGCTAACASGCICPVIQ